jgi:hypothetical protein
LGAAVGAAAGSSPPRALSSRPAAAGGAMAAGGGGWGAYEEDDVPQLGDLNEEEDLRFARERGEMERWDERSPPPPSVVEEDSEEWAERLEVGRARARAETFDKLMWAVASGSASLIAQALRRLNFHGALAALAAGRVSPEHKARAPAGIAALLNTIGTPGSRAVLEVLAYDNFEPLEQAARNADAGAAGVLLTASAPPGSPPSFAAAGGAVALPVAAESGNVDVVRLLLSAAGPPGSSAVRAALAADAGDAGDVGHRALLAAAARINGPGVMALLLQAYGHAGSAEVLAAMAVNGHKAIRTAARHNNADAVRALLAASAPRGAFLSLQAAGGCAALLKSIIRRRNTMVDVILAAAGPPGSAAVRAALATDGHGALRTAVADSPGAVPILLQAYGPPGCPAVLAALAAEEYEPLRSAVRSENPSAVRALVDATAPERGPPSLVAAGGYLALTDAVNHGLFDMIELLLSLAGPPGSPAMAALLGDHSALRAAAAASPTVVPSILYAYGPPGCPAVLAALAADDHIVLYRMSPGFDFLDVADGGEEVRDLDDLNPVLTAYGAPGNVRLGLAAGDHRVLRGVLQADDLADDDCLTAVVAAYGERDNVTALRALGSWIAAVGNAAFAFLRTDSLAAQLAVQTPEAWRLDAAAARALLSPPVRAAMALPLLLAVRRLPFGIAGLVAGFLRARPWRAFAAAAFEGAAVAEADGVMGAPPPPPNEEEEDQPPHPFGGFGGYGFGGGGYGGGGLGGGGGYGGGGGLGGGYGGVYGGGGYGGGGGRGHGGGYGGGGGRGHGGGYGGGGYGGGGGAAYGAVPGGYGGGLHNDGYEFHNYGYGRGGG